jgi:hypothetical protein
MRWFVPGQKKGEERLVSSPHVDGKYHPPLLVVVFLRTTIINTSINDTKLLCRHEKCKEKPLKFSTSGCALDVHFLLLGEQFINGLTLHFVSHAAVYRTNGGALRLFMKSLAFGALIGSDIVGIH